MNGRDGMSLRQRHVHLFPSFWPAEYHSPYVGTILMLATAKGDYRKPPWHPSISTEASRARSSFLSPCFQLVGLQESVHTSAFGYCAMNSKAETPVRSLPIAVEYRPILTSSPTVYRDSYSGSIPMYGERCTAPTSLDDCQC